MPIFKGLRSTTIWKAFLLNSIASSLIIVIAITIKNRFDIYKDINGDKIKESTSAKSLLITIFVTFAASYTSYVVLYLLFGFGGGMLS
jgi:hypothetical protein